MINKSRNSNLNRLNPIIKKKNKEIHRRKTKWDFLKWIPPRNSQSHKIAINNAVKYFNEIIIPDLLKKNVIINEKSISSTILEKNGYRDFISAIYRYKISYNDLLKRSKFKLNKLINFWNFLDWNDNGNPRMKEKALENAKNFLLNNILTDELKIDISLGINEAPTRQLLIDVGYHDFFSALYKRKLKYNDILRKTELKINKDLNKYSLLNWNPSGNPRTKEQALENAVDYLFEKILTYKVKKKYNLVKGECPTSYINEKSFHNFLWRGLYTRKLLYNEVIEKAGLIPHNQVISANIGKDFHWIGERILLEHTRKNNCLSFYEIYPCKYSTLYNQNHCDICIIVNINLKKLSEFTQKIPDKVKILIIDFYMGSSEVYTIDHCLKGYQDKNKFLILVPINTKKEIYIPEKVPHRNQVKILNSINLLKFLGINGALYEDFLNSVEIAQKAIYNDSYRIQLKNLAEKSKKIIKIKFDYGQKDLENHLKNELHLLSFNPGKQVIDYYL